jgi:O-antigen/teichoic acid export membrane protein
MAIIGMLFALYLSSHTESPYAAPLMVGAWIIPLWSMIFLHTAIGRVFGKIMTAYAPPRVLKPALLVVFGAVYISTGRVLTGTALLSGTIIVLLIVLTIQWISLDKHPRMHIIHAVVPATHNWQWFQVALNVLVVSGMFLLLQQTNTLLLGIFLPPEQVALYSAAAKTTQIMHMPATAVGAYAVPMFAALYARKEMNGLQSVLSKTVAWSFWPSALAAAILCAGAPFFLGFFGPAFKMAAPAVVILTRGGLISAGGGPVLMLMQVTGYQRDAVRVIAASTLTGIFLSIIGIYTLGITGAALATVFTSGLWVLWLNALVRKKIKVYPSILHQFRKRGPNTALP